MTLGRRRVVRVPASTANLGPGFDVMAAALSLALEVEVVETGSFAVHTELDVPRDRSNLVVRAFEALHPADDFQFRISSQIPLTGGLGSSAAAIVAGLVAADHIFELDADLMSAATELEGHPDNVAAALFGSPRPWGWRRCSSSPTSPFPRRRRAPRWPVRFRLSMPSSTSPPPQHSPSG
jgi:homoserine kinase